MGVDKSLKRNVNAIDKINDIRLSLNSQTGSRIIWVLVEGKDDCKIYPKFLKQEKTKVEYVNGGKGQLETALQTLTNVSNQVIGIRDADFSHLENTYPPIKNLFFTDFHDIEMTMLSFKRVRSNLFTEYDLEEPDKLWENILDEASYIGYIRWYNEKTICQLLFKGLTFGNLANINDGIISIEKTNLITELNVRSTHKKEILTTELVDEFIIANNIINNRLNLCNGHDVTALMSLFIGSEISKSEFCRHLRLSFQLQDFVNTKLYFQIYEWQVQNGFDIIENVS